MNSYIHIQNSRIYAFHGVGAQETLIGNEFIINLRLKVDITQAMLTDCVEHTVSYADVYQAVKEEMSTPSQLLEHAAGRIVKRLFNDFPTIEEIKLRLDKRNPPMGADADCAGVEVLCTR